jgi:hypothetical protein
MLKYSTPALARLQEFICMGLLLDNKREMCVLPFFLFPKPSITENVHLLFHGFSLQARGGAE